ncbi:hypothetical protein BO71DRAFT_395389 [Aspergillus ellipticus CBS 707.79]|uniref:Uncharacterized protein n=1 Tax=Aspergillus ellipticus CBS 707.79 TaxID=1448320 RepID=A0A319DL57_9EURO|nr:hypothetical protein BO71DRAFT_395389 [Aspergillus ellipticus CBS 707.79]
MSWTVRTIIHILTYHGKCRPGNPWIFARRAEVSEPDRTDAAQTKPNQAPVANSNPLDLRTRDEPACPSTISGGGIAGIVLGTIAGTLLLLWLSWLCAMPMPGTSRDGARPLVTRTRHRRRRRSPEYYYVDKPRRGSVRRPAKVYLG